MSSGLIETELHELSLLGTREGQTTLMANGNAAIAWAAVEAGVDYFSHYPGSPVAQIAPMLRKISRDHSLDIHFNDALNEHIATLAAGGASFCGARSLVVMKHVGLNIAADPINYLGYTGVKGGMVIVIGTDPGANSSTGEEDTHWYVAQTQFPLFEPTSVADIRKYTLQAFEISEKYSVPVFIFLPGRIAYNSDLISIPAAPKKQKRKFFFEKDIPKYINVGQQAVRNHKHLLERIAKLANVPADQQEHFNPQAPLGLLTRGATFGHVYETVTKLGLADDVHLINLDRVFPLHRASLLEFGRSKQEIVVIEDQDGFLENQLKMELFNDLDCRVTGKEHFPKYGEIEFGQVMSFLASRFGRTLPPEKPAPTLPERMGTFCEGCPHRSSFWAIDQAIAGTQNIIGGDIGCSSLPPQRADWLLCMNAGIGISQGMSHILKDQSVISTGGEGSFFHAGLISLHSAVLNHINLLHVVFDNRSVAMTGHQDSPTTHDQVDVRKLLESIGVNRIFELNAFDPIGFTNRLKTELKQTGVRVLWVRGDCALQPDADTIERRRTKFIHIENEKCGTCNACYQELGCPAITRVTPELRDLTINLDRCMRCGVCIEICPNDAIRARYEGK